MEQKLKCNIDNLKGYYQTFNNCREQGLMLKIYDNNSNDEILIWACESRNSDRIMIITSDKQHCDINNMFDDKAWNKAKYFKKNDYDSAVNYVYTIMKKQFYKNIRYEYNTKFKMYRSLDELRKIKSNINNSLDDALGFATYEDLNTGYFCDLIIDKGKLGLRYSKYYDDTLCDFDYLSFEEWNPDLTSDKSLMLGMQSKLQKFVEAEMDYSFNI